MEAYQNGQDQPPLTSMCGPHCDAAVFCGCFCPDAGSRTAVMFISLVWGGAVSGRAPGNPGCFTTPAPGAGATVPVGAPSCAEGRGFVPAPCHPPGLRSRSTPGGREWGICFPSSCSFYLFKTLSGGICLGLGCPWVSEREECGGLPSGGHPTASSKPGFLFLSRDHLGS